MNKSQIKEFKYQLNKKIGIAFGDAFKREIYDALDVEKVNCVTIDEMWHEPTKLYSLLWALLDAPQIHTMASQRKKAIKVSELGRKDIAAKYIAFLDVYVDEADAARALEPDAKPAKVETPIEELMKRQAKKDGYSKFIFQNRGQVGNAHILEDNSLYINGDVFAFETMAEVGIKLGMGDRAHKAHAFTGKDKKTGEIHVYVSRNDQYYRSQNVAVIDLWNRIPNNLKSEK